MKITAWLPQEIPGAYSWCAGLKSGCVAATAAGWKWRERRQKLGFNSPRNQSGFMLCPQLQTSQQRMSGNWKTSYLNLDSMSVITIN